MSLIHTCELCQANPLEYLTELERHAGDLPSVPQALDAVGLSADARSSHHIPAFCRGCRHLILPKTASSRLACKTIAGLPKGHDSPDTAYYKALVLAVSTPMDVSVPGATAGSPVLFQPVLVTTRYHRPFCTSYRIGS